MKPGSGFLAAMALVATACSPPADARIQVDTPSLTDFSILNGPADLLDQGCGTLDCHGNAQRNLVMWGCYGLRLSAPDQPGCRSMGGMNTTSAEYTASFRSLVGLEPAVMSDVVDNKGANPNELTFMRKAFGQEEHKGGQIFQLGSTADTCLESWLAGATDRTACASAVQSTSAASAP